MAQLELSVSKEVPNIKLHRTEASKIVDSARGQEYFVGTVREVVMTTTTKPINASRRNDQVCACLCCCKPTIERTDVYVT